MTRAQIEPHLSRLNLNDGTEIFIRDWLIEGPEEGNPQPCIVIMHGLGEHCGRYQHIARFLNECGFSVRTFDHRGHGQSEGARGDIPDPLAIVRDAELVIQDFAERCQTSPILFGHSLGGLFAARIATAGSVPLLGLILSSPALALHLGRLDYFFLKIMSAIAPHFAISNGLNSTHLSHDPAVNTAYDNDPLVHKKITASMLNGMLAAMAYAQTHAPILTIPTLLLVAEDDYLVDPQGSHDFFDSLPSNLGTAHFYADFYHEIFNETEAAKVFSDLKAWLSVRNFTA
jgi:alpha-beta hydrolase superfamily lysophospholipase